MEFITFLDFHIKIAYLELHPAYYMIRVKQEIVFQLRCMVMEPDDQRKRKLEKQVSKFKVDALNYIKNHPDPVRRLILMKYWFMSIKELNNELFLV